MSDTSNPSGKTLEMRVAELEDKLAQTQITEADIKAFQKVAAAMAARGAAAPAGGAAGQPCVANQTPTPALSPQFCVISPIFHCIISQCVISHCVISHCIISPIILNDCTCGPCQQASTTATPTAQKEFGDLGS
jgi:hypothetical protein